MCEQLVLAVDYWYEPYNTARLEICSSLMNPLLSESLAPCFSVEKECIHHHQGECTPTPGSGTTTQNKFHGS